MSPSDAVIWIFLVIFALTALVALGSLVGWVKLEPAYKKTLFRVLILQVISCVVGYAGWAFRAARVPTVDMRNLLLSSQYGWDWQYAQANWRSRFYFRQVEGGKFTASGETNLVDSKGQEQTILTWESTEPFEVKKGAGAVTFKAQRTWTEAGAKAYPQNTFEVGRKRPVEITLHPMLGLEGQSRDDAGASSWGIMMTPAFP